MQEYVDVLSEGQEGRNREKTHEVQVNRNTSEGANAEGKLWTGIPLNRHAETQDERNTLNVHTEELEDRKTVKGQKMWQTGMYSTEFTYRRRG